MKTFVLFVTVILALFISYGDARVISSATKRSLSTGLPIPVFIPFSALQNSSVSSSPVKSFAKASGPTHFNWKNSTALTQKAPLPPSTESEVLTVSDDGTLIVPPEPEVITPPGGKPLDQENAQSSSQSGSHANKVKAVSSKVVDGMPSPKVPIQMWQVNPQVQPMEPAGVTKWRSVVKDGKKSVVPYAGQPAASYVAQAPYKNVTRSRAATIRPHFVPRPVNTNQVCIDFTFDNPNYHYAAAHPWGSATGTFGSLENGRLCMDRTNAQGGAFFIGAHPNPSSGSTKLECFFGLGQTANCDMSLVDGFSLPVTCTMGDTMMGGEIDLWQNEGLCPDVSQKHLGICGNTREDGAEKNAPTFFQSAIRNGNNYCIWTHCTQNPYFPVDSKINCHVGSTKLSPASKQ